MRVGVVGCGYVGLVTGTGLAALGHDVVGIEVDGDRRELISSGVPPFHEPGLADLLSAVLASGAYTVDSDVATLRDAEVIFLAVQTPPRPDGALDYKYLVAAAECLRAVFREDTVRRVVAVRSTVVPGTVDAVVAPVLADETTAVAANPEFLREGSAVEDFSSPDRIVIGCDVPWGADMLSSLYAPLHVPIMRTAAATAELSKCTSNALLATLISFSNEIARIAEATPGVDAESVMDILHRDARLSPIVDGAVVSPAILSYLRAGCGFGGSCLPKDIAALERYAVSAGEAAPLLSSVSEVNRTQPARLVDRAASRLGGLEGRRVTVLGVAFKSGTSDIRESPGLSIVEQLLGQGAVVTVFDPLVGEDALQGWTARGVRVAPTLDVALTCADAWLVTTNAPEFRILDERARTVDPPLIVDGRRLLDADRFVEMRYVGVGRAARANYVIALTALVVSVSERLSGASESVLESLKALAVA